MNRFIAAASTSALLALGPLAATAAAAPEPATPVADSGSASGSGTLVGLRLQTLLCQLKGGTMTSSAVETAPPSHCTVS
ncbi:hypothetical protein ACFV4K_20095 [Nocardia sp. NPDC059764]|uniref:hypothetical protein n=1 Tax=Nocardia sp. NPDC059764 TaxID=3346939 RepID=UPI00365A0B0D